MAEKSKLKLDKIGYWSEVKLDIVRKYAAAYSRNLNAQKTSINFWGTTHLRRLIMAQLTLNSDEAVMLREVLVSFLSDLRMEIADTDQKDFRDDLKEKEVFLKDLINRLGED